MSKQTNVPLTSGVDAKPCSQSLRSPERGSATAEVRAGAGAIGKAVLRRVGETAGELAFDEVPGRDELLGRWRAAHARWHRVRRREAAVLPDRLRSVRNGAGVGAGSEGTTADGRSAS